ncbi:YcxB family protein [Devosia sp. SL43]|uniref:YcxB family protein n=1 Tax=Devosia sp. SL43 TaxID=2806348 RepID=UPI001F392358|nr:YcxB family protein [Devosia sp. SL43]UJW84030.1 YcxB family protein [Devosia sp. SL43]
MSLVRSTGTFRLTAEDMAGAALLFTRVSYSRPRVWMIFGLLWLAFVAFLIAFADGLSNIALTLGLACLPFIVMLGLTPLMTPITARRNFARQRSLQGDLTLSWSEAGLRTVSEYGTFEIPWSHFNRRAENGNLFLLFESDRLYRLIPKRVLTTEQQADVRSLIESVGRSGV